MEQKTICVLLLVCILISITGCRKIETQQDKQNNGSASQKAGFYTTDEKCFTFETKYSALEYPEKWKSITKIEVADADPYTVKFFCVTASGDVPLFDMYFGVGVGFLLGSLQQDGQKIPVYLDSFNIDQSTMSEEDYFNCCAMQDDVNVIISRLIEKNGFVLSDNDSTAELPEDNGEVFAIETKYGKLSYPEKWKKITNIEITEDGIYTVKFSTTTSAGKVPLFDLTFNGGNGYCLGTMESNGQDVTIYIDDYTFDQSTLSEEEYFNCCAMQEDVNAILDHLTEDYGFSVQ